MQILKTVIYNDINSHEFHIEMYDQYFYLIFGESNRKKIEKVKETDIGKGSRGAVVYDEDKAEIIMWFPDKSYERVLQGTLAHECIHLIDFVSQNKGIKHDVNNSEIYAQFIGMLFRNLLPFFKK